MVTIASLAHAVPEIVTQQTLWDRFFAAHYDNNPIARRMFSNSGVSTRHAVANPIVEDVSNWSTAARMSRYVPEATALSARAVDLALHRSGISAADVGLLAVVSCTGYASPGVDTLVAERLDMSPQLQRLVIGHMGCYAALPGLRTVHDYVATHSKPAVLVCVELSSLHLQPSTNDVEQIVAHSLFSDAASCAVITPEPSPVAGLELVDAITFTDSTSADLMTWHLTDLGFRMRLSQRVPDVLAKLVRPAIDQLLHRNGLQIEDIEAWAAHPGGPRIIDVIADALELKADMLNTSREILAEHGNCSSATVLMVIERLQADLPKRAHLVALAFGPGLTLYASLLRVT